MSLFSFGVGADIWSSAGFAFVSPINDILDKDTFTLEEILAQDEVLQEVKSVNPKLVEFLSQASSIREMMAYLAEPPPAGAQDNRVFKFPYMSCEIICCEVSDILHAVADDSDQGPLRKLFSMLDEERNIDAHRAGYLEKILTVLLKHRCGPTTAFINAGGLDLFRKMVRHLGNFSIMQVAKLLLLPKYAALQDIDATALMAAGRGMGGFDGGVSASSWCNWSDDPGILDTLLGEFRGAGAEGFDTKPDEGGVKGGEGSKGGDRENAEEDGSERSCVHMHLSELLLALIAQCSPESIFLKRMFSKEAIDPLVAAATLTKEQGRQATGSKAALQILAALGDRLVRPLPPFQFSLVNGSEMQVDRDLETGEILAGQQDGGLHNEFLKVDGQVLERGMRGLIPSLCAFLQGHTEDPAMITAQTKEQHPRMGSLRLQVVRFLETLVGMDNPLLDEMLIQENAMATCLEMMFTYETSSMLHTSVAASVLTILIPAMTTVGTAATTVATTASAASSQGQRHQGEEEQKGAGEEDVEEEGDGEGGAAKPGHHREVFQRHLFEDCRLVERILEAVALNEDAEKVQGEAREEEQEQGAPHETATSAEGVTAGAGAAAFASAGRTVPGAVLPTGVRSPVPGKKKEHALMGVLGEAMAGGEGSAGAGKSASRRRRRPGRRLGHMGHVLLLSKAILDAVNTTEDGEMLAGAGLPAGGAPGVGDARGGGLATGGVSGIVGGEEGAEVTVAMAGAAAGAGASKKSLVGLLVSSRECAEQWQEFVSTTLVEELGKQLKPLGGFPVPSREEENQLSSDFPDEAVDMDETPVLLETISRLQTGTSSGSAGDVPSANIGGGGASPIITSTRGTSTSTGAGVVIGAAMNDSGDDLDEDDGDDFEASNLSGDNGPLSMTFMSNAGPAWGSLGSGGGVAGSGPSAANAVAGSGDAGATSSGVIEGGAFGGGSASTSEGWANFADFGDAQQAGAAGAATSSPSSAGPGVSNSTGGGANTGGFSSFDPVFAMDSSPPRTAGDAMTGDGEGRMGSMDPGSAPTVFAPSPPPNWAPRPNSGDTVAVGALGEAGGGGDSGTVSGSNKGEGKVGGEDGEPGEGAGETDGGGGGGGFADFSQFEPFADFSAMMEDAGPTSTTPAADTVTEVGNSEDDDRMEDDTEEEEVCRSSATGAGTGLGSDASAGLLLSASLPSSSSGARQEHSDRDSIDAMVGSDDDEKEVELKEGEGRGGDLGESGENPP